MTYFTDWINLERVNLTYSAGREAANAKTRQGVKWSINNNKTWSCLIDIGLLYGDSHRGTRWCTRKQQPAGYVECRGGYIGDRSVYLRLITLAEVLEIRGVKGFFPPKSLYILWNYDNFTLWLNSLFLFVKIEVFFFFN